MGQVSRARSADTGMHCMADDSPDTFEPFDLQSNHECPKSQGEVGSKSFASIGLGDSCVKISDEIDVSSGRISQK